ncbi:host specificity factor TipJ family phage tail protein [Bosea minatitlanensis]|uniref:Host specificity factor TipJ family phage tail protein n=1 Tax=Bosea minatitlanensis TaxID=128782 RepID=A0ABW0EZG0_9HYPH|nr:host specificity factor TipJ family phage tail protein [Bosea minatitlanensis]MCT4492700.1 host specificity factor TipJ family phage tail protein [Bosea minatitlanensis]
MSQVLFQRVDGKPMGKPVDLPRARRRLSALVRRHADHSRPYIVSVHRRQGLRGADPLAVTDMSVRLRKTWSATTIGPRDVVIVTYLPRGGGGGASGQSRAAKGASIGLLVATVALAAVGQFWAIGAINGALGFAAGSAVGGTIWAGVSAAALAGGAYLLSRATQAKANKTDDRPVYGVSGGGNLPRSGDRIPVIYGRCWTTPDLSQPDYTVYVGDDSQDLYKRLTIGCGKYAFKSIRVAGVTMWTADGGLTPAFTGSQIEFIAPGAVSALVPGQVATVAAVGSNTLPKVADFPNYAGPFEFGSGAPLQQRIQLDFSLPQGCYAIPEAGKFEGKQYPTGWGVLFEYAPCDIDGTPTGPFTALWSEGGNVLSTRPMRYTRIVDIPLGRYTFRARNTGASDSVAHPAGFSAKVTNAVVWEGLRAHIPQAAVRPGITELAMKIHAGKELSVTSFGEVEVEVSRILPVWNGTGWTDQETEKCVWAFADVLMDQRHGCGLPAGKLDLDRLLHYATTLTEFDGFSGVIRGPVSAYEALSTILGTMRASPLRLGSVWTLVRDEAKAVRKHVISRRQILKDTTGQTFNLDLSDGSADIIVEWLADGDPRRTRSQRVTFGTQTANPRRMQATGARTAEHAIHIATWAAATAYYRRERRAFSMEYAGRMLLPNDAAVVDAWYFDALEAAGVLEREGLALTFDTELVLPPDSWAILRGRDGLEWGPVAVTQDGDRILLNADDVAAAQAQSGLDLDDVLSTATQAATTVVIGALSTVQDGWLVRSIQFDGETRVNVEAVFDAPQVWSALAEPIVEPPPPPSSGLETEASVTLSYVSALAVQRNAAMFMDWTVGRARSAAEYQVVISYDDWVTSEPVYRGPASSGSHPLREFTGTIRIRARGIAASGLVSPWIESAFSVAPAVIDLGNSGEGTLPIKAFLAGMQPVGIVDALPDLFGYEGPNVVVLVEPGEKPRMYQIAEGATEWAPLAAEDYVANTITAAAIQAGAVKATAIDVAYLSAISAQLGSILGGSLNINNRFLVAADGTLTLTDGGPDPGLTLNNRLLQVFYEGGGLALRLGRW